jgi:hypothetical protein
LGKLLNHFTKSSKLSFETIEMAFTISGFSSDAGCSSSVNNFLKKWKPISTLASLGTLVPNPLIKTLSAGTAIVASKMGYGKGRVKKSISNKKKMAFVRSFKKK